ncbi:chromosome segregation protein SMC [Schnuerera sp. xch1]|uniref:chromosome segregation protein SMC n=1 Tax=Schnuerera sp. xch1 TaxID=2874283 RepID=UPI001CBC5B73|nr:chromosome segregation protein SMC [Schnuerera sp. xch1]MBZ2173902.1 chromosome segregation protein SMC [Schnuerera sp. xch1]
MHLKKIDIQGFKSFADKIEVEFKEGITAVVGPNGSGKSNIADAIRWVLGEQSAKTLRGSRMEDIIFSGTSKRRALGYAEVTITFDNLDGVIPIDYQEVAITRRMFRSGESEYYLNKNSCRLKDIKELFMDTGVGKDGYSIIGQGRVDEILSNRPEDRRHIFEEAAGIVKYKTKKNEAENKLEKTDNNLLRIKDILSELEKQYDNLKEQSKKASQFLDLSNKLKEIEVNLLIRKVDKLKKEIETSQSEKEKIQDKIDLILKDKDQVDETLNSIKLKIEDKDLSIESFQKEKDEITKYLNKNENDLTLLQEKKKFYIKDIERLNNEMNELNSNIEELKNEKTTLTETNAKIEEELDVLRKDYNKKNIRLEKLNENIQKSEKEIEDGKDRIYKLYNLITDKKSKLNNIVSFKENISKRIKQIEKDIDSLSERKRTDKGLLEQFKEDELKKEKEIVKENRQLANLKLEEQKYKDKLDKLYAQINQNKVDLQGKISNFNLLKNMEEDYEGYYKSVKNLMLACKKDRDLSNRLIGIVADLIKVEPKYEKAIQVALGGSLQNVVTKDENDAKYIINYLRNKRLGRITFLPISTIKSKSIDINPKDREQYNIIGLGSELVTFDDLYKDIIEYLLGRTIVVDDLDDANLVARRFNYSFRIVTIKGDIINPGGSMTGGSLSKVNNNLLNRKFRIEKIKKEINELSKTQEKLEQDKSDIKLILKDYSQKIKEKDEKLHNINIEIIKIENEKNKYATELDRSDGSIVKFKDEIKQLKLELNDIDKDKKILEGEIEQLSDQNNIIKANIEELMEKFEKEKDTREGSMEEVTDVKIRINSIENRLTNNREKLEVIENKTQSIINSIDLKKNESESKKVEIDEISNNILLMKDEIEKLLIDKKRQDEELTALKRQKEKLMNDFYLKQNRLKEINEDISKLEKSKNSWDLKETKRSVNLENIYSKLLDEYELNYEQALELWIELDDLDKATKEVKKLKNEIKRLGSVNLSSIKEFEAVKERLEFMTKQHKDLLSAKEDLKKVIRDMEEKMKKQFLINFKKINEKFNEVFSILFGGGKASIALEDEEDILNCGIEVKVQPPGKKLQNLNLLSGGEKSLTAVTLLFAILKVKPTPFCILDEIDAALDDANIGRYTNYLKNFAANTQFIMITHRQGTMEMADVLYGVTMEEEGISKIVSVKLTDNLEEVAS